MRRIGILAFEQAQLLDMAGPLQTFATAAELAGEAVYETVLLSRAGGLVTSSAGVTLVTIAVDDAPDLDTLIVVGGAGVHCAARDAVLLGWIGAQASSCRRLASVCTGAFLLAAAGLLAGRRAVTHWSRCDELQSLHPDVTVVADPIYLRDGDIWTSAGVTAGIDLALAFVEADLGHSLALATARRLIVFLKRPGGQSQFSAPLAAQAQGGDAGAFEALHAWISDNLDGDLCVDRLAAHIGMSPRSFARLYTARMGRTPAKSVEAFRIEAARRALEEGAGPIKQVAARTGFGDEERMRRAFLRQLGVNPQEYRSRFATVG